MAEFKRVARVKPAGPNIPGRSMRERSARRNHLTAEEIEAAWNRIAACIEANETAELPRRPDGVA